jgi:hypothetical protein
MSISGIEIKHQNYASSGNSGSKSSLGTFDLFQKELVSWEKRVKEALDKEQEYDGSGDIRMSEKQWDNLMKKVDSAIDTIKENIKEDIKDQEQEAKKEKSDPQT